MAEKGFGVKEINLIGASGTPTIESPNNLNLNAVNVAISTNVSIGGTLTISGSLSIGGTITYEDVTNVDAIGIITARQGVRVNADSGNPAPASATNYFSVGASQDLKIYHNGGTNYIAAADGDIKIRSDTFQLVSDDTAGRAIYLDNSNSRLELGFDGYAAAYFSSTNVQFAKPITASADSQHDIGTNSVRFRNAYVDTYYGDGSNLTGIAVTEAPVTDYTITGDGSNYYFHGGGVDETDGNPDLYLIRGQKYRFNNTTGNGHPFRFTSTGNKNDGYSNGVTGSENGIQFWTIPYDAPAKIFYVCTIHGGMVGNIYIRGAGGQNDNVGVTTFSSHVDVTGDLDVDGHTNLDNVSIAGVSTHTGLSQFANTINLTHASAGQNYIYFNEDLQFAKNGTGTRLKIDSSGNVDIGSGTHSRNLTVHAATNSVILIEGASNGTSNLMFGDENDEDVGMLGYNHLSNYLAFTVNTEERLRILSSGHSVHGGSVGIQTNNIDAANLSNPVGAGHSLVGLYIGDGSLLFSDQLARVGGYYITTGVNALNAGPVTLNSEMTLDGTWTIV